MAARLNISAEIGAIRSVETRSLVTGEMGVIDAVDAVVLAVGSRGMGSLMAQSPECAAFAPELARAGELGAIDVVSVRLWLDRAFLSPIPPTSFPVSRR